MTGIILNVVFLSVFLTELGKPNDKLLLTIKLFKPILVLYLLNLKQHKLKKLFIAALLAVGMTSFAQVRKVVTERPPKEQMSLEQRNQLQLKKMTLELDLNASQQKEMSTVIAEQSTKRDARMAERKASKDSAKKQLTAAELFAKKNQMLDEQIVMKERMKKILSADQYKKWEDIKGKRHHAMKKRMVHHKDGKPARMIDKK